MNYLAHLALSDYDKDHILGNFLTDLSSREEIKQFSKQIQQGVKMHHHIDGFTDRHPLVLEAKSLMPKRSRRYAGILLDLYFDHLLIRHWEHFYDERVELFIPFSYEILQKHEEGFPQRAQIFSQRLREFDILSSYADIEGIRKALSGVDRRLKKSVGLHHFLDDVLIHKEKIDQFFVPFYNELQLFVKQNFLKEP